jgi:hypothetical protein
VPLRGQFDERFTDVCMRGSSSTWCLLCALLGLKFLRATYHRLCPHGSRAVFLRIKKYFLNPYRSAVMKIDTLDVDYKTKYLELKKFFKTIFWFKFYDYYNIIFKLIYYKILLKKLA